jgi:hypothetical protein
MRSWLLEAGIGVLTVICMSAMAVCWAWCRVARQPFKVWRMFEEEER